MSGPKVREWAEKVRESGQKEAGAIPQPERFRIVEKDPLRLESYHSDAQLIDGEDDFELGDGIDTDDLQEGDSVLVLTDRAGDRVITNLVPAAGIKYPTALRSAGAGLTRLGSRVDVGEGDGIDVQTNSVGVDSTVSRVDDDAYLWKRHGILTGVGQAAQDDAIADLIDLIDATAIGGEMRPDRGDTMANVISVPPNRAITMRGYGSGWRSAGGAGTRIRRKDAGADTDILLSCLGTGLTDSSRALLRVAGLMLHGGRDSDFFDQAPLLVINRGQQIYLEDLYLFENDGYGASFGQCYNSHFNVINVTHCGSPTLDAFGRVQSALHFGGMPDGGEVRFIGSNWHVEQSFATDVRLGSPESADGYVAEFIINGLSMEGGLDEDGVPNPIPYPYLHLGFAEQGVINGLYIFSHRSVPSILSEHPAGGGAGADDPVKINGGGITQSPTTANPDYFVDLQGGSMHFDNFYIRGKPNIAYFRVGADARPGALKLGDLSTVPRDGSTPPKLVEDNRAIPEFREPF